MAFGTAPEYGEVVWVDAKAVAVRRNICEVREDLIGSFIGRAACFANEMPVGYRCKVVGRWTMAKVRMRDDPEPLELFEVSVNRREVHVGGLLVDLARELLCGSVRWALEQAAEQRPTRRRHSPTLCANKLQHRFNSIIYGHVRTGSNVDCNSCEHTLDIFCRRGFSRTPQRVSRPHVAR